MTCPRDVIPACTGVTLWGRCDERAMGGFSYDR